MESLDQPASQEASTRSPEPMQQEDDRSTCSSTTDDNKTIPETGELTEAVHREDSDGSLCSSSVAHKQPSCEKLDDQKKVVHQKPSHGAPNRPKLCLYSYIIHGGNAATLVDEVLRNWGWHKTEDKTSTAFTMKWSESKQSIDYLTFREGDQLVNHFPNISLLTTKIGLLESLRHSRSRLFSTLRINVDNIVPETYRLDVLNEREEFFQLYKDGEQWICKPTGANQGKGIFLIKSLDQVREKLSWDETHCRATCRPTSRIVQRYISNPLLLEGRKFDIRAYMLLMSAGKLLAFYRDGYIRLSCLPYDAQSSDMTVHLTNQFVQKKHPSYKEVKEDTVWSFAKFQSYMTEKKGVPEDWVATTLTRQMRRIMLACHHSICHRLDQRLGYFELLGFDFMLDSENHIWLIEVNINPAMSTNCDTLKAITPNIIEETLGIAVEVWSKNRRSKPIFPIKAQKSFITLNV